MSDEETFLSKNGVRVTNARFIVHGETYSMANVTSVKTDMEPPDRKGPFLTCAVGVLSLMLAEGGAGFVGVGGVLLILGVLWWKGQSPTHSLILSSASGEVRALSSEDGDFVNKVEQSLNQAIVARG